MTIKYRVWDKKAKEMNTVWSINFVGGNVETDKKKIDFDDAQLMQYTGFNDKKNVEIFEGDIISIDVYYTNEFGEKYKERNYAEVFRDDYGYWDCDFKDNLDSEFLLSYVNEDDDREQPWNITVVGNVYSHSHLLAK